MIVCNKLFILLIVKNDMIVGPERGCVGETDNLHALINAVFVEHVSPDMELLFAGQELRSIYQAIVRLGGHSLDHPAAELGHEVDLVV